MTENDFFAALDPTMGRPTVTNWQVFLERVIDDYEEHASISHGVQKDAIQNSWDARRDKKGKNWGMRFELLTTKGGTPALAFMDWGTTGLTGRILEPHELDKDLPPEERWGRFENLAFTKDPSEEALGARGQGKFIFLAASKSRRIVYDTIRGDGIYRLGVRMFQGKIEILSFHWEGDEALAMLKDYAPELEPLDELGTRVIIDDPIEELLQAFNSGSLDQMIGETWWEIIHKYEVDITVNGSAGPQSVECPPEMLLFLANKDDVHVYSRENELVEIHGKKYRIKQLVAVYAPNITIPEALRGISVQRGGMKVTARFPLSGPREAAEHLTGFITFDRKLDREMAKTEASTHYNFSWRKLVPLHVRRSLDRHLGAFYQELGLSPHPEAKKHRKRREAERHAIQLANKVAKALGITGKGKGGKGKKGKTGGGKGGSLKPVSITMPELDLPSSSLRVEFGEMVGNVEATVANRTDHDLELLVKIYVTYGRSDVVAELLEVEFGIPPKSTKDFGPMELELSLDRFDAPGAYYVRSKLVNMMAKPPEEVGVDRKGREIDKAAKVFYLAEDPPEGGLWEDVLPIDWSDEPDLLKLGEHQPGESGGYIYYYNVKHRAYEALNGDEEGPAEHIYRLLVHATAEIDLESEEPVLFEEGEVEEPNQVARKLSGILGQALHDYHSE